MNRNPLDGGIKKRRLFNNNEAKSTIYCFEDGREIYITYYRDKQCIVTDAVNFKFTNKSREELYSSDEYLEFENDLLEDEWSDEQK